MKQIMLAQTEEYSNSSSYYINGCSTESLEDGSSSDEINGALFGGDDIIADDILDTTELVIYNVLGEQIYTTEIVANTSINLDINSWKPGVYSVVVNMKDNNLVYRFILE